MLILLPMTRSLEGLLPGDFPQRLERFKEASGLTWTGLARRVGVSEGRLRRWRRGTVPQGGALFCLFRVALTVPGGIDILIPGNGTPTRPSLVALGDHAAAA